MYDSGLLMPPGVVTVTFTTEGGPAGALTVIWVGVLVRMVAGVAPKRTWVAPVRLVPVRVTVFPPEVGPEVGLRLVRVGAETVV
ncbi:hypothetical protein SVIO_029250 [Streptomyces violaceusniger]|uniref:Uncharacterized protein n=1 Tax=Streptomyces violaceusniger TaxID=68280 RepID=A0A4D4KUC6_STRVO|nr:hypothetical protein SVIO_029250 [Streptomyces violaceusniger]